MRQYSQVELEAMRNVVVGGWDSYESYQAALSRGEIPAPGFEDFVVEPATTPPNPYVATADKGTSILGQGFPTSPSPGVMLNVVAQSSLLGGAWAGFDPGNIAGGLAVLHSYAQAVYGSIDLGILRRSSEVLEQEPSGIRPGTMPRIVIPVWARNERGSPI